MSILVVSKFMSNDRFLLMFGRSYSAMLLTLPMLLCSCDHNNATPAAMSDAQELQLPASAAYEGKWENLELIGETWTYRQHHGWKQNGDAADELLCSPRKYIPWSVCMDETHGLDARTTKLNIKLKVWMAASGEPEAKLQPSAMVGLIVGVKSKKTRFIAKASLDFPVCEDGGYGIVLTADHKIQIIDFQSGKLLKEKQGNVREDGTSHAGLIRGALMVSITQENQGKHKLSVDVEGTEISVDIPSARLSGAIGLLSHPGSIEVENAESVFSSYSVVESD